MTNGQTIKTLTGKQEIVREQWDNIVYCYSGNWYHVTKIIG